MAWDAEWTIESVEGNYRAIGMIDPEDIEQLIADAKELRKLRRGGVVVSKGEAEKIEQFKRQVAANRR